MLQGPTPPTWAADSQGTGLGGRLGSSKLNNSVCVKPVSEGEAFSSLSSLPPTAAHEATKITRQEV